MSDSSVLWCSLSRLGQAAHRASNMVKQLGAAETALLKTARRKTIPDSGCNHPSHDRQGPVLGTRSQKPSMMREFSSSLRPEVWLPLSFLLDVVSICLVFALYLLLAVYSRSVCCLLTAKPFKTKSKATVALSGGKMDVKLLAIHSYSCSLLKFGIHLTSDDSVSFSSFPGSLATVLCC